MSWIDRVRIIEGDIANAGTEAVVNAANNELWMGSGVAGALRRVGGVIIEQEAVKQGPIAVGESVLTTAGDLPALHVIHAAAMAAGRPATAETVYEATRSALRVAVENNIESISLPALGTGVGGLSLSGCAKEMFRAIEEHCLTNDLPSEIHLVLFGSNAMEIFQEVLGEL